MGKTLLHLRDNNIHDSCVSLSLDLCRIWGPHFKKGLAFTRDAEQVGDQIVPTGFLLHRYYNDHSRLWRHADLNRHGVNILRVSDAVRRLNVLHNQWVTRFDSLEYGWEQCELQRESRFSKKASGIVWPPRTTLLKDWKDLRQWF